MKRAQDKFFYRKQTRFAPSPPEEGRRRGGSLQIAPFYEPRAGKPSSPWPSPPVAGGEGKEYLGRWFPGQVPEGRQRFARLPWANFGLPLWGAEIRASNLRILKQALNPRTRLPAALSLLSFC